MARHILHVDLDAFFVAVEQAKNPELAGKPVVVGGEPGSRGVVATASYEARAYGVHSAMSLREAQRLCPHAIFLRGDYGEYVRISRLFHAILEEFSPLVESGGLDEAYLDVTGCEPIAGPPREAAEAIRGRVKSALGIACSIGISGSKLVSKVASDRAKPDGICEVPAGGEAAFLAPLPLRALPMLGPTLEKKLVQLGLSSLGQLAALSPKTLEALLGKHGPVVGARARGIDASRVGGEHEAKSVSREGTFFADVVDPNHLRAVLRGFSESVATTLRRTGRRSRTVSLKLRLDDFTTISRSVTLKRPANSNDAIYDAANGLLNKIREAEKRPVRLIGVGASNLGPDEVQLSLEPGVDARNETLSATFDRVRRKYGTHSLQTGRTAFDPATRSERGIFDKNTGLSSQMR